MSINAGIIDQRVEGLKDELRERADHELRIRDEGRLRSLAFVYLAVKTILDLEHEEAFDCLTEGGGDFGVDAMHIAEEVDGEFAVTLFQAKYQERSDGIGAFGENGIKALINAIRYLFDPAAQLQMINPRLAAKVEAVRSMVRDGLIPRVRAIACNNGEHWNKAAQEAIDRASFGDQVVWEFVNHDVLVKVQRRTEPINETIRLAGRAVFEDMQFSRVCIGRIPVVEVADLMRKHSDRLLERNIRRYLGLHGNRVNEGIRDTLISRDSANFYFFNNGLTFICRDFAHNALQESDFQVRVEDLQIVNGGQTCMTIYRTDEELRSKGRTLPVDASVLVRIYKLPKDNEDIVLSITHATNSQNPVDLKDLRANDERQQLLAESIAELGYSYRRKRADVQVKPMEITSGTAAEAILAVWRHAPHQAKFLTREHFGKLYETIFTPNLNGAQVVLAVLVYRTAENHRRRPADDDPPFVRYASCFIAMQMGRRLLRDLGVVDIGHVDHRNFQQGAELVEKRAESYFRSALQDIDTALRELYGDREISLQQLSATFRRGDLIDSLLRLNVADENPPAAE